MLAGLVMAVYPRGVGEDGGDDGGAGHRSGEDV
eukprot:CAMPEP_0117667440 /NCGR_PEP_ID=MMETSP0804-20121206/10969_1 /TAXON_ID=1074897 /ORGANISM="Tetraselmis astigmatica, Strain CCMP880" /LENGTH=32 /DNA_ID= /DNA_START= /DNA_END= /DNA_ORIENTATION=